MNWGLLAVLVAVLAGVVLSNIWLRRRAEAEAAEEARAAGGAETASEDDAAR